MFRVSRVYSRRANRNPGLSPGRSSSTSWFSDIGFLLFFLNGDIFLMEPAESDCYWTCHSLSGSLIKRLTWGPRDQNTKRIDR